MKKINGKKLETARSLLTKNFLYSYLYTTCLSFCVFFLSRLIFFLFFFLCFSLGPLVSKVKEYQVETIVDTLCTNMLSDKEQLRDISSIGLKTVIGELPPASSGKQECFFLLFPFYKWKCFSSNFFFLLVTQREREMYLPLKDLCKYPFEQ